MPVEAEALRPSAQPNQGVRIYHPEDVYRFENIDPNFTPEDPVSLGQNSQGIDVAGQLVGRHLESIESTQNGPVATVFEYFRVNQSVDLSGEHALGKVSTSPWGEQDQEIVREKQMSLDELKTIKISSSGRRKESDNKELSEAEVLFRKAS